MPRSESDVTPRIRMPSSPPEPPCLLPSPNLPCPPLSSPPPRPAVASAPPPSPPPSTNGVRNRSRTPTWHRERPTRCLDGAAALARALETAGSWAYSHRRTGAARTPNPRTHSHNARSHTARVGSMVVRRAARGGDGIRRSMGGRLGAQAAAATLADGVRAAARVWTRLGRRLGRRLLGMRATPRTTMDTAGGEGRAEERRRMRCMDDRSSLCE